jgi:hypothetical protein
MAPGEYDGCDAEKVEKDGTPNAPVVIKAQVPNTSVWDIDGKGIWAHPDSFSVTFHTHGDGIWHFGKHYIYEDLHFNGNNGTIIFHIKPGAKGFLTIRDCHFSNCGYKAIKADLVMDNPVPPYPDYMLLENNTMEVGIAGFMNNNAGDYLTCRNNYMFGFETGGVGYLMFSKGGIAYSVYENNLVDGGKYAGISIGGGSMGGSKFKHDDDLASQYPNATIEGINCIVRNNIILNAYAGVSSSTTLDCEFYNNTIVNCSYAMWFQAHHGDGVNLDFSNNLMINTGGIRNDGAFINKNANKTLNVGPTTLFHDYRANDLKNSDFRINPAVAAQVGNGQAPDLHADWNLYALLSNEFYDYYGTIRPDPPLIGATEVYSPDKIDERPVISSSGNVIISVKPNPARSSVTLVLNLKRARKIIDILVYDIRGKHVRTLYYGPLSKGISRIQWDGKNHGNFNVPAGTYIFRVSLGREILYNKVSLVK